MSITYVSQENLQEFATKLNEKQKTIFAPMAAVGAPLTAETAAGMTDETKVYVYAGEEVGYTYGNWYYYDGTGWVSGGVYNATVYETDTTLTESGKPADAKAAGDDIRSLNKIANETSPAVFSSHETQASNSLDLANVWQVSNAAARVPKSLVVSFSPQQNGTPTAETPVPITGSSSPEFRMGKGNLYNGARRTGTYIDTSGELYSNSGYQASDYIDVTGIHNIRIEYYKSSTGGSNNRLAFYDKNRRFISIIDPSATSGKSWKTIDETVPDNAAFMRIGCITLNPNYMVVSGDSTLYTITLPDIAKPFYGGYIDLVNGKAVSTMGEISSYDGETLPGAWLSSMDVYSEGATPTEGAQVVYELAEPITYTITPIPVTMFDGKNMIQSNVSRPNTRGVYAEYVRNDVATDNTIRRLGESADYAVSGFTVDFNPYITGGKIAYGSGAGRAGSLEIIFPAEYNYFIAEARQGYTVNVHEVYSIDGSARTVSSWNYPSSIVKIDHDSRYVVQAAMREIADNMVLPEDGVLCTFHLYHDIPMQEFCPIYSTHKEPQVNTIASELLTTANKRQPQGLGYGDGKLVICFPTYGFMIFDAVTGEKIDDVTIESGEPYGHMNDIAYRNGSWYVPYYNADGVAQDKCFVFDDTFTNPTEVPLLDENGAAFACWRFCYNRDTDEFYAAAHNDYTFLVYNGADMSYKRTIELSGSTTITGSTKTLMQGCDTDGTYLYCTNVANNFSCSFINVFRLSDGKLVGTVRTSIGLSELEGWAYDWDHKMWYQMYYDKPDDDHRGFQLQRINPYSQPDMTGWLKLALETS